MTFVGLKNVHFCTDVDSIQKIFIYIVRDIVYHRVLYEFDIIKDVNKTWCSVLFEKVVFKWQQM